METYHYEQNGLFLGFLSYPYYIDGRKDIYYNVIKPFFENTKHKTKLKYN